MKQLRNGCKEKKGDRERKKETKNPSIVPATDAVHAMSINAPRRTPGREMHKIVIWFSSGRETGGEKNERNNTFTHARTRAHHGLISFRATNPRSRNTTDHSYSISKLPVNSKIRHRKEGNEVPTYYQTE